MIHVEVSYTVKPGFAAENRKNIAIFLDDLRGMDTAQFRYSVFVKRDGCTFVHRSAYADKEVQQQVLNVPSFLAFQAARDASGLDGSHAVEILEFVGATAGEA